MVFESEPLLSVPRKNQPNRNDANDRDVQELSEQYVSLQSNDEDPRRRKVQDRMILVHWIISVVVRVMLSVFVRKNLPNRIVEDQVSSRVDVAQLHVSKLL